MEGKIAKLSVFPESGDVGYGDESDVVAIIQIMLNTLKLRYDGYDFLKVTFLFDDATEDAVRTFSGSEQNGNKRARGQKNMECACR